MPRPAASPTSASARSAGSGCTARAADRRRHARLRRREPLRRVSGAFVVQLWHGIPLKRIGLDSPETLRSGILPGSALGARRRSHGCTGAPPAASTCFRPPRTSSAGVSSRPSACPTRACRSPASRGSTCSRAARPETRRVRGARGDRSGDRADAMPRPAGALRADVARRRAGPRRPIRRRVDGRIVDVLDPPRRRAAGPLASARRGRLRAAVPDRARAAAWAATVVIDVTPLLPGSRRTGDRLLVARLRCGARAAPGGVPRARRRGLWPQRGGSTARTRTSRATGWARDWTGGGRAARRRCWAMKPPRAETRRRGPSALSERVHAFRDGGNTGRVYRAILAGSSATKPRSSTAPSVTKGIR